VFGQAAIEAAAPAAGERVLDVGCGAGASNPVLAAGVGAAWIVTARNPAS
jgi:cyclopropane fatty-acyl-phospholipid synthase-like methyltransferase